MLEHLGEHDAARRVLHALEDVCRQGPRTRDIGGDRVDRGRGRGRRRPRCPARLRLPPEHACRPLSGIPAEWSDIVLSVHEIGRDDLGYLLAKATQRWNELLTARFRAAGFPEVRASYGSVLVPLFEEDGLRMGELARRSRLSKQTMTTLVRLVERDGLVTREPDPVDARAVRIWLTDRSEASGRWSRGRSPSSRNGLPLCSRPPAYRGSNTR